MHHSWASLVRLCVVWYANKEVWCKLLMWGSSHALFAGSRWAPRTFCMLFTVPPRKYHRHWYWHSGDFRSLFCSTNLAFHPKLCPHYQACPRISVLLPPFPPFALFPLQPLKPSPLPPRTQAALPFSLSLHTRRSSVFRPTSQLLPLRICCFDLIV